MNLIMAHCIWHWALWSQITQVRLNLDLIRKKTNRYREDIGMDTDADVDVDDRYRYIDMDIDSQKNVYTF